MVYLRIKEVLKEKKKTKYWLVKNMDSSYQSLSKLMNNETVGVHFDTIDKLCEILSCSPADLICRKKGK